MLRFSVHAQFTRNLVEESELPAARKIKKKTSVDELLHNIWPVYQEACNMSIDPQFIQLTADVFTVFFFNKRSTHLIM